MSNLCLSISNSPQSTILSLALKMLTSMVISDDSGFAKPSFIHINVNTNCVVTVVSVSLPVLTVIHEVLLLS